DIGRRDLVRHLGGRVAQHPLGADVEDLDDALGVGGDAREVRAVEDRALQRAGLQERDIDIAINVRSGALANRWHGSSVSPCTHRMAAWRSANLYAMARAASGTRGRSIVNT